MQAKEVHTFQRKLQDILKNAASRDEPNWEIMFSPRLPLHMHPLRALIGECRVNGDVQTVMETTTMGLAPIATTGSACITNWLRFGNGDSMNNR